MSLQVWLPLNGDTHNQGLTQLPTPTVNTFTFSDGGKIGRQSTSGSGKIAWHLTEDFLSNNKWTVATWIKATQTFSSANNIIFCKNTSASSDCQIYFSIVNGTSLVCGVNGPSSSLTTSYTFTVGTWYHVATTYNGNTVALYINGEQKATKTVTTAWPGEKLNMQLRDRSNNTAGTGSGGSAAAAYAFNDFRIYDHALSAKEVEEIAKGLVLHYKLDNLNSETIIYDSSGYNNNGIITGTITTNNNSGRYNASTYISAGNTNYITTPTLQLPGDQITMNFWFKSSNQTPGSNYHMPFEGTANSNQAYEMSIYKTGYLRGGLVVAGTRKVDNCTSTKLTDGNWHMCSMTYDGTTIKRYVDATMEKSTAATGALVTSSSFVLGHYGSNTSYHCKEAYLSDVRLYTTALTEAQIKELYNTSMSIDNQGNIHARELVEV